MAAKEGSAEGEILVYRISTAEEWEHFQKNQSTLGGDFDKSSGFVHLSSLHQVKSTLDNFFKDVKVDLYLLQLDAKKHSVRAQNSSGKEIRPEFLFAGQLIVRLGNELKYERVDAVNYFPHLYGPLPLDAVVKAEKLFVSNGQFSCDLLLDQDQ